MSFPYYILIFYFSVFALMLDKKARNSGKPGKLSKFCLILANVVLAFGIYKLLQGLGYVAV